MLGGRILYEKSTICFAFSNMFISKNDEFQTNRKVALQDKPSPVTMFIKNITFDITILSID